MDMNWTYVLDVAILSLLLGVATYLKRSIKFFKTFIIPNAIIAGFLGLLLGPEVLKLLPLDADRLGNIIYHLMAVGFIALALKERKRDKNNDTFKTGIIIVTTYLFQGILGFGLTLLMVYTIYPGLFPAFGLLLPLGYGQGPGNAYNIGHQWEFLQNGQKFLYGGNIGLSIAAFGFLWACFGGVIYLNYFIKKKKFTAMNPANEGENSPSLIHEEDDPDDIPLSESIDRISVQIFLIGIIYLVTYLTLSAFTWLFGDMGTLGRTLSQLLWGFNFLIGTVYAILFRIIFDRLKKKKVIVRNYPNNFLLQRIAGGSFDFMIAAAISAISISILKEYLVPTLIITTAGGILTMVYLKFVCKRYFKSHLLESILALYGMLTGTVSTGLALLREIDPHFRSDVAKHLVMGSGVGLIFGFPLMMLLSIPVIGIELNKPIMFLYTMLAFIAYMIILFLILENNRKKKSNLE